MIKNWKNALVFPDCSIREVVKIIDRESMRAAFIVDQEEKLLGVVTDGDVRRALLKNIDFDTPVQEIMNSRPLTCTPCQSRQTIKSIIEQHKLLHMPIVSDGKIVDVVTLEDFSAMARIDNPVFIMAGGFGSRLSPLTDDCPKPMLNVGGKPILESIISRFIQQGFYKFYISVYYKSEIITSYFGDGSSLGIEIHYINETKPLGTAGALGLLPANLPRLPMILINADILTLVNIQQLLDYHTQNPAIATMCVQQYEYAIPYGVVEFNEGQVTSIKEKPSYSVFVNAGIYVLEPEFIHSVEHNKHIDMPDLVNRKIESGEQVNVYPLRDYWLDIGRKQDFEKAQIEYYQVFDE
ncbi:nucleotidyltransferase family protein [Paraneptunicella aestuarii]|nr:nucleotidyltransferase family protein [Paraneptunicella aestuarii]